MTNKSNQLEKLFESKNKKMQQVIQNNLLKKNKFKVKSLPKTTVLTIVALIGAVVFSLSLYSLLINFI